MKAMNKTAKKAARKTCSALMLVVLAFLTTLPIFWCIITSLKTPQDISAYPPKVFNFTVTWNNYKQVFAQSFLQTAWNSVVYSLLTILACLVLGYLAAYGFERRRFPLKKLLFYIVVIGIPLSTGSSVLLIPNYLMMMKLHLTNHWYTLPLLYTAYNLPLVIWMLISGVRGLPREIEEAAAARPTSSPASSRRSSVRPLRRRPCLPSSAPGTNSSPPRSWSTAMR